MATDDYCNIFSYKFDEIDEISNELNNVDNIIDLDRRTLYNIEPDKLYYRKIRYDFYKKFMCDELLSKYKRFKQYLYIKYLSNISLQECYRSFKKYKYFQIIKLCNIETKFNPFHFTQNEISQIKQIQIFSDLKNYFVSNIIKKKEQLIKKYINVYRYLPHELTEYFVYCINPQLLIHYFKLQFYTHMKHYIDRHYKLHDYWNKVRKLTVICSIYGDEIIDYSIGFKKVK